MELLLLVRSVILTRANWLPENDKLGGDDPYSASKASAEMYFTHDLKHILNHKNVRLAYKSEVLVEVIGLLIDLFQI